MPSIIWAKTNADGARTAMSHNLSVRLEADSVVLEEGAYHVPLELCRTHTDVLAWSLHLSNKAWVTPAMLRRFAEVACKANRLPFPQV